MDDTMVNQFLVGFEEGGDAEKRRCSVWIETGNNADNKQRRAR
jgi:hypothetical protein